MRWCIDPVTLAKLKEKEAKNPYLLIIVWNKERWREERTLVPLDRMMHYLQLRFSGENAILATIVWNDSGKYGKLWDTVFASHGDGYDWMFVNRHERTFREDMRWTFYGSRTLGRAEVSVVVEKEFFAKEPPEWLKDWVNFWFETQPRDECHFRRRAILAFTIQPVVVIPYYIIKSFVLAMKATWFLLWTMKVDLRPIIAPWIYQLDDIREGHRDQDPVFFTKFLWPLTPFLLVIESGFIMAGLSGIGHVKLNALSFTLILKWLGIVVAAEYGVVLLFFALGAFGGLLLFLLTPVGKFLGQRLERLVARQDKKVRRELDLKPAPSEGEVLPMPRWMSKFEARYTPLICSGNLTPSLAALPKERQTLTLKFLDLKARICKPFAG